MWEPGREIAAACQSGKIQDFIFKEQVYLTQCKKDKKIR